MHYEFFLKVSVACIIYLFELVKSLFFLQFCESLINTLKAFTAISKR